MMKINCVEDKLGDWSESVSESKHEWSPLGFFQKPVDTFCEWTLSCSVLEIITEINDVAVFDNTCMRWQVNPGRINNWIVYVVSK